MRIFLYSIFAALFLAPTILRAQSTAPSTQPTTAPATQPAPQTFTTMQAILQNTPADLQPRPTRDWHKFTQPKFLAWWSKQLAGLQLHESFPLTNCTMWQGTLAKDNQPATWQIYITLAPKSFTYFGQSHTYFVHLNLFNAPENEARQWDAAKKNTLIPISATIDSITIGTNPKTYRDDQLPSYQIELHLKNIQFSLPK